MRVVKERLVTMMPHIRAFLDVDDLKAISNLQQHIDRSRTVLIFVSDGCALRPRIDRVWERQTNR